MQDSEPIAPMAGGSIEGLPGFTHAYSAVNGTQIHYVIGGMGPILVLLHGWPYTWEVWRKVMPLLASQGYTVIAPDLRGLGDSALEEAGYSKTNVAADIHELVQSLGFEHIHLLGMDIGMMVAFAYALRYPEEIGRLILTESLIPGFGLEELMNPATGGYWHFGFHMQVAVADMLTAGKEEPYLLPTMGMMSLSPGALEVAKAVYLPSYKRPGRMRAGFEHYGTLLQDGKDNRERMKQKLAMPVLVLSGEHGIPQSQTLGCVRQVAENVETDLVPNAGHLYAHDNPEWVAERLHAFLSPNSNEQV